MQSTIDDPVTIPWGHSGPVGAALSQLVYTEVCRNNTMGVSWSPINNIVIGRINRALHINLTWHPNSTVDSRDYWSVSARDYIILALHYG